MKNSSKLLSSHTNYFQELVLITSAWLLLAAGVLWLGKPCINAPGLYYDEAVFAGMAKDFFTSKPQGEHLPDTQTVDVLGRPLPLFVQSYLGALKVWLLLPSFKIFGFSLKILRLTNASLSLIGLLVLMLAVWRLAGCAISMISGLLLAFDPTYFFLTYIDWGAATTSFLCRTLAILMGILAWQRRSVICAGLMGFFLGLGIFNKIDFSIIVISALLTGIVIFRSDFLRLIYSKRAVSTSISLGFIAGVGPMWWKLPGILASKLPLLFRHDVIGTNSDEWLEKIHTWKFMFDGSYFYRLMQVGGLFDRMAATTGLPAQSPLAIVTIISAMLLVICLIFKMSDKGFFTPSLITSGLITLLGILLLPEAVRIHHTVLLYPLPQIIIATSALVYWRRFCKTSIKHLCIRLLIIVVITSLSIIHFFCIHKTNQLVKHSGGRGWWSTALIDFANSIKDRADVTIVSLDWGFNEQLMFLTEKPALKELFYEIISQNPASAHQLFLEPKHIYLAYTPEFQVFHYDNGILRSVLQEKEGLTIQPWRDRSGEVVFYSFYIKGKE